MWFPFEVNEENFCIARKGGKDITIAISKALHGWRNINGKRTNWVGIH